MVEFFQMVFWLAIVVMVWAYVMIQIEKMREDRE